MQLQDDDGNMFTIRNPVNPKEISKLHQLFLEANLTVNFRPEHQFLLPYQNADLSSEVCFITGAMKKLFIWKKLWFQTGTGEKESVRA